MLNSFLAVLFELHVPVFWVKPWSNLGVVIPSKTLSILVILFYLLKTLSSLDLLEGENLGSNLPSKTKP
jgi:hypothetical protein